MFNAVLFFLWEFKPQRNTTLPFLAHFEVLRLQDSRLQMTPAINTQRGCFIMDSTTSPTPKIGAWAFRLQLPNHILWSLTSPSPSFRFVATGSFVVGCFENNKTTRCHLARLVFIIYKHLTSTEPTICLSPSYYSSSQFDRPNISSSILICPDSVSFTSVSFCEWYSCSAV